MLKTLLISLIFLFFTGCSFKLPFSFFKDELKEANLCKENYLQRDKVKCYEKLENNSYAQLRLGTYYADNKEFLKALSHLNKSYSNKNIYSNVPLAFLYFQGEGVPKDLKKSFELLKESSNIDPNAAYQLSRFYLKGVETNLDENKGLELLNFAASKNMTLAIKRVIDIYTFGFNSIKKDPEKVRYWENKLKENGIDKTYDMYKL